VVTAREDLFDALPETDESAALAAEVVAAFRSAVTGATAVVVDLRRAGEVNKRTVLVSIQLARALSAQGAKGALCGSKDLKKIWDICRGYTICQAYQDMAEALAAVSGPAVSA
jgi:hypothetical protein